MNKVIIIIYEYFCKHLCIILSQFAHAPAYYLMTADCDDEKKMENTVDIPTQGAPINKGKIPTRQCFFACHVVALSRAIHHWYNSGIIVLTLQL